MELQPIDSIPLWLVFVAVAAILFISAEIGFYLGKWLQHLSADKEAKQTGALMGASLGMLAFMLAFSFASANSSHGDRKALVLEESNAVGTAWLRAQLIPEPASSEAQRLLREYVDVRVKGGQWKTPDKLKLAIEQSEELQNELWRLTTDLVRGGADPVIAALFVASVNDVIDLHAKRLNAGRQRIPATVSTTLLFIAIVTLTMMGDQAGLNGIRTLVARVALIIAFSSVMLLIIELDRPGQALTEVSQKAMLDLQSTMANGR